MSPQGCLPTFPVVKFQMRIIGLAVVLLLVMALSLRAQSGGNASAAYCVAVFDNGIAKSKWALSVTHSQFALNDIARIARKRDAALRELSRHSPHLTALNSSNPAYAKGLADLRTCEVARNATNGRECLERCMAQNAGAGCMDNCFIAGSAECSRTMNCMTQFGEGQ
jgi:hypothetical protein